MTDGTIAGRQIKSAMERTTLAWSAFLLSLLGFMIAVAYRLTDSILAGYLTLVFGFGAITCLVLAYRIHREVVSR